MLEKLLLGLINIYQRRIRAMLPRMCRFTPSCSEYAQQAISKYGFCQGSLKGLWRLAHCHPFSRRASYDPLV